MNRTSAVLTICQAFAPGPGPATMRVGTIGLLGPGDVVHVGLDVGNPLLSMVRQWPAPPQRRVAGPPRPEPTQAYTGEGR